MPDRPDRADHAAPTLDDLVNVLAAVIAGRVRRDDDWEYAIVGGGARVVSNAVYALDECRLVSLGRDGTVRDTAAGRIWLANMRGLQVTPGPAPLFRVAA